MSSLRALAGSGVGGLFHCEGLSLSCLIKELILKGYAGE